MLKNFRLRAALRLTAGDTGAAPRFAMHAYDGGLLRIAEVPVPVVIDLTGLTVIDQPKVLLFHDPARPIGHVDRCEVTHKIAAAGTLSVPGQDRDQVVAAQQDGFEWESSVGCTVEAGEKVPPRRIVEVNGRQFTGPIVVARQATLREISFVGSGAGDHTTATIAATAVPLSHASMADELDPEEKQETTPVTDEGSTDPTVDELKALRAQIKADLDLLQKQKDELQAQAEDLRRERAEEHVETIAAQYGVKESGLLTDLKAQARSGALRENEIELQLLRASRGGLQNLQPYGAKSGAPATPHVIEAALCLTGGWSEADLGKHFDAKTLEAASDRRMSGFGPKALMIEFLRANGHHVIGGQLQDDDIREAIHLSEQSPRHLRAAGAFSTISLPGILSNVAKKELLRGYDAQESAILKIAKRATATDYKPFFMYRMTTDGLLEQIGPDGELRSLTLKEDEYQSRVYPWGRKLSLTDVMFKNDDLGAFSDLARLFGVTTKRTISKQGATVLLSDQANFWKTDKGNRLASGAGSALDLASLADAYKLFLEMKDSTGESIDLEPKYLFTGPANKVMAVNLHTQQQLNLAASGTSDAVVQRFAGNSFVGMFEPLHAPHLANQRVPNANGTQWLLCADPAITAPIVAAFLDGRDGPQIRTWEAIPGRLGMQWDVSCSFGFNLHDERASVYSPGQ